MDLGGKVGSMIGVRKPLAMWDNDASDNGVVVSDQIKQLRQQWELASVLNFLHVFEPLIDLHFKVSDEEIETALIEPNDVLAQLHIALLKGIIPWSKPLNCADAWIVAMTKMLPKWWPWVAEGEFPLTTCKGDEISRYKELEPSTRLFLLKALCEVRSDQHDFSIYINAEIKNGTPITKFQKQKFAGDDNEISFWYDGGESIGCRLYKEVRICEYGHAKPTSPDFLTSIQWETVATNLEQFRKIMESCLSSEVKWEAVLGARLETDIIPIVEKHQKKKHRAMLQRQRENVLLSGFKCPGLSRSCRTHKNVDYTFDNYDKAISEAIQYANERKTCNGSEEKQSLHVETTELELTDSKDTKFPDATEHSDWEQDSYVGKGKHSSGEEEKVHFPPVKSRGLRFSKRLRGIPSYAVAGSLSLGTRKRLKQRPSVDVIVPDSEDDE